MAASKSRVNSSGVLWHPGVVPEVDFAVRFCSECFEGFGRVAAGAVVAGGDGGVHEAFVGPGRDVEQQAAEVAVDGVLSCRGSARGGRP